jgi:hypothetical protein
MNSQHNTFAAGVSKAYCTEQEMFGCKTCHIEFGRFNCFESNGREVFSTGNGPGYCDCSILSDFISLHNPLKRQMSHHSVPNFIAISQSKSKRTKSGAAWIIF